MVTTHYYLKGSEEALKAAAELAKRRSSEFSTETFTTFHDFNVMDKGGYLVIDFSDDYYSLDIMDSLYAIPGLTEVLYIADSDEHREVKTNDLQRKILDNTALYTLRANAVLDFDEPDENGQFCGPEYNIAPEGCDL